MRQTSLKVGAYRTAHNAEVRGAPPALSAERPSSTAVLDPVLTTER